MVFGIADLERDVRKFEQDIANAKSQYLDEFTEYLNIITDFQNVEQKDDFLQKETEAIEKVFPEESRSSLSKTSGALFGVSAGFELAAAIGYGVKRYRSGKLTKFLTKLGKGDLKQFANLDEAIKILRLGEIKGLSAAGKNLNNIVTTAKASRAARQAKIAQAARTTRFLATAGLVLGIVGIAVEIASTVQRKKYLKEKKDELQQHLDDFNGFIAEANDETKTLIEAFSIYFDELEIDVDGVFNDNQDGFLGESETQKFEDAVSQLRGTFNEAISAIGGLNASIRFANRRIERYIDQGLQGQELIEEVVFDVEEISKEFIQRLYVFKLRELGSTVQEAIELSELPEDLVKKVYARGYLDDGKTVEETVELSGLTEDQVRRVLVSKLLDDELTSDNPDDVLDIEAIAEKVGLSEEIVREIRAEKLADLLIPLGEEEPEPELVTS